MRMGNFLGVERRRSGRTMTTQTPAFGMDHPTVVPVNFEPERRGTDGPDPGRSESDESAVTDR